VTGGKGGRAAAAAVLGLREGSHLRARAHVFVESVWGAVSVLGCGSGGLGRPAASDCARRALGVRAVNAPAPAPAPAPHSSPPAACSNDPADSLSGRFFKMVVVNGVDKERAMVGGVTRFFGGGG
jgi:hypothetical protein